MKRIMLIALLAACSSESQESAEEAAKKQECRAIIAHLFEISPETAGKNSAELVKQVPIEDLEQCSVADPAVLACLKTAPDVAAVKACIPPPKKG